MRGLMSLDVAKSVWRALSFPSFSGPGSPRPVFTVASGSSLIQRMGIPSEHAATAESSPLGWVSGAPGPAAPHTG